MKGESSPTSPRTRRRRLGGLAIDQIDAMLDRAADHYAAGRMDAARGAYEQVEAAAPDDMRARYSLAVMDLRVGRRESARHRLSAVLRRQGDHFAANHNLGVVEQELGNWGAAARAYGRALDLRPDAAETAFSLSIVLAVLGRIDEAIALYRSLAARPPLRARALTRLAILRPEALSDDELTWLSRAAADGSLDAVHSTSALFALGGALEARGQDDPAWEAFAKANALQRRRLSMGVVASQPTEVARQNATSVGRIKALFTREFLAEHGGRGDATVRPIFIIGMPRSGSSLVEQILASHPRTHGMGESGALWETLSGRFPYPPDARRESDHFRRLARRYLAAQRARGWNDRLRLIDKTLDSHLHVGMLHLIFPEATILRVVRDPVDTGLACWRQLFAHGNETLYDLAEIGAELRRYETIMAHWREVLPGRVTDVGYEALTADPDREIRRLVTRVCQLPWAAECLSFHQTGRAVGTASVDQVRRPIYQTAVGRWRRYETRLAPLLNALGSPHARP